MREPLPFYRQYTVKACRVKQLSSLYEDLKNSQVKRALCIICSLRTINTLGAPVEPEVWTVYKRGVIKPISKKMI